MHKFVLTLLLFSAACSPSNSDRNLATYDEENRSALSKQNAASSDDVGAVAAKDTVEQYFQLIAAEQYDQAWEMWDLDGKAWGGDAQSLADHYAQYSQFEAEVGEPTEIKTLDNKQFIHVDVTASVQLNSNERLLTLKGRTMLVRALSEAKAGKWYVSGMDLRVR
jgi:hypothetical protein